MSHTYTILCVRNLRGLIRLNGDGIASRKVSYRISLYPVKDRHGIECLACNEWRTVGQVMQVTPCIDQQTIDQGRLFKPFS